MTTETKLLPESITLERIKIEVRGAQLYIWPNKKHPGSPVIIDTSKLERWASRLYREGVLQ